MRYTETLKDIFYVHFTIISVINHDAADAVAAAAAGGGDGRVYHHHHHLPAPPAAAASATGGASGTSSQTPSPGLQVKVNFT